MELYAVSNIDGSVVRVSSEAELDTKRVVRDKHGYPLVFYSHDYKNIWGTNIDGSEIARGLAEVLGRNLKVYRNISRRTESWRNESYKVYVEGERFKAVKVVGELDAYIYDENNKYVETISGKDGTQYDISNFVYSRNGDISFSLYDFGEIAKYLAICVSDILNKCYEHLDENSFNVMLKSKHKNI